MIPLSHSPVEALRSYIRDKGDAFLDLRHEEVPADHLHDACPGYIFEMHGRLEYLFPEKRLREIVGRPSALLDLKKELALRGLIAKAGAGDGGDRFAVKRMIGSKRRYVSAIDARICDLTVGQEAA